MNIAIAHKDYDVRGGGEMLAEVLAEGLDAPLVVGHGNPEHEPEDKDLNVQEIGPQSHWHRLAARGGLPRAIAHMMLWRDHADEILQEYDVVVTSGNEPQWWMPREEQTWVAYTHSTPRWMYDRYHEIDGWIGRTVTQLKRWIYQQELHGADAWVANSDIVKRRMVRYWNIPPKRITVVYPPIDTIHLSPDNAETGEYYLTLGRLAETKRIGEQIKTANALDIELRIAGTGPRESRLRELAGDTVKFEGWVSGERKRKLLAGAKALLNTARNEDFGMVPIEAMASGTPVITVNEGMPQHTVLDGKNGLLFERAGNNDGLAQAIGAFETHGVEWSPEQLATFARENFGTVRFVRQMRHIVEQAKRENAIEPEYELPT